MKETIVKINKTKSQFFEKIKLANLQPDSSKKKKKERRIKSTKSEMKNERLHQTVMLEKTLESPLTSKESNHSVLKETNPKQSLEGLAEVEAPKLWPHDAKSQLTGKDIDARKD